MEAKIRDCIDKKQHLLIESVPGFGTTSCLMKTIVSMQSEYRSKKVPFGVVYIARNYETLKHVSKALKESYNSYNRTGTNYVVLGSRRELCLVEEIRNQSSPLTQHCRCEFEVMISKTCKYGICYKKGEKAELLDIEDLKACKQANVCPFFAANNLKFSADAVLITHEQIFNSTLKCSHEPFWQNKVVVIDDAETLDSWCENSLSRSMTWEDLRECIEIVKSLGDVYAMRQTYADIEGTEQPMQEISVAEISCVVSFLEKAKCFVESAYVTYTFSIAHFTDVLQKAGNKTKFSVVWCLLKKLVRFSISAHLKCGSLPVLPGDKLEKVAEFLEVLARTESYDYGNDFKMCLEVEVIKSDSDCTWLPSEDDDMETGSSVTKVQWTLYVWCFNPSLMIESFLRHKPKCLIICTGNIHSFPSSFRNTLCIEYNININDYEKRLLIRIVKQGPGGVSLRAPDSEFFETLFPEYYYYVDVNAYCISVGRLLTQVAKIVPLGIVVFFASFELLECCVAVWKENGTVWKDLAALKSVVVVDEDERPALCAQKYCAAFSNHSYNGAILLTISGRWVSRHSYKFQKTTRAVLCFGVFYDWQKGELVRARMKFADFQKINAKSTHPFLPSQPFILDGNQQHNHSAHREISEALAVCDAAHKTAIFLCDPRIEMGVKNKHYPLWLERGVKVQAHDHVIPELKNHFGV